MTSSSSNMDSSSSSSPKRKAGRKKFKETRHPIYRGVRARNNGKWVCEVREPNKKSRIWLGTYPTPEMAARAHDVAAIALRGESAALNFADSGRVLPRARSRRVDDIRHAASQAAEMYRQREGEEHAVAADTRLEGGRPTVEVEPRVFVDEEAMLDMPGLLREMAEGMMVTPPGMVQGSGGFDYWYDNYTDHSSNRVDDGDEGCGNSGMSLWSS